MGSEGIEIHSYYMFIPGFGKTRKVLIAGVSGKLIIILFQFCVF